MQRSDLVGSVERHDRTNETSDGILLHRRLAWPIVVLGLITLSRVLPAGAQPPAVEPSPELERLHFQLGSWSVETRAFDPGRAEVTLKHRGPELAFVSAEPQACQAGVPRNWRKIYSDISEDSYLPRWHDCEHGEPWVLIFESTLERSK